MSSPQRGNSASAVRRAAWVYALRDGWTESERRDLTDAEAIVSEIIDAYEGRVPADLLESYGDELEATDA